MKLKDLFQSDGRAPRDPFELEPGEGCCGQHKFCLKAMLGGQGIAAQGRNDKS